MIFFEYCDGVQNCADGSDEQFCGKSPDTLDKIGILSYLFITKKFLSYELLYLIIR